MPYLLKCQPYDPALGGLRALYFSDVGFTSEPTDAIPNTYFVRRIETPLTVKRSLFSGTSIGGFSAASFGRATLANDDGAYDWLSALDWDGRFVEILYTPRQNPALSDFVTLFSGTAEQLVPGDEIAIVLRDLAVLLDGKATRGQFGGTGGVDGSAQLKGRDKPFLLGRRRQIEPVLINAVYNVYMIDPLGYSALIAARDQGVAFAPPVGDYSNYLALVGASLTGAQVATAKSSGLVRLGQKPNGRFTVDADGVVVGGSWIFRFADLVQHAVTSLTGVTAASLNLPSFALLNALQPGVMGYWCDGSSAPTVRALIDELADSPGAYWGFGEDRLLALGRYDGPASVADFSFDERHILELTPRPVEKRMRSLKLGWRPFAVTFGEQELNNATTAADREAFQAAYRWTPVATSAAATTASLLARDEEAKTSFDDEGVATAERDRRLALYSRKMKSFTVVAPLTPGLRAGCTVSLTDSRYGLAAGWLGLVLEAERNADDETHTMTVIGNG